MAVGPRYPIPMTVAQWGVVDGSTDNEIDGAVVAGDLKGIEALATSIREDAWDQVLHSKGRQDWPPREQEIVVALTLPQWALAYAIVDRWAQTAEEIGDTESADTERRVRDRIQGAMAQVPGWMQTRDGFLDTDAVHDYRAPGPDLSAMPTFDTHGIMLYPRGRVPSTATDTTTSKKQDRS
ncbi:hypothetical protein GCM10010402_60440 [Actinomadura luteofluorescens]|nr:hypothetical protein [Actinomadura glauciflava]